MFLFLKNNSLSYLCLITSFVYSLKRRWRLMTSFGESVK